MNVLMINGNPHAKGNTYLALQEMAGIFEAQGIETEILHIGNRPIMAFLMKSIALGKEQYGLPEKEAFAPMNFIR